MSCNHSVEKVHYLKPSTESAGGYTNIILCGGCSAEARYDDWYKWHKDNYAGDATLFFRPVAEPKEITESANWERA